ncbi:MAG: multicopper oxidase domain-containing protein [Cyanobacteria bacterium J06621_8]
MTKSQEPNNKSYSSEPQSSLGFNRRQFIAAGTAAAAAIVLPKSAQAGGMKGVPLSYQKKPFGKTKTAAGGTCLTDPSDTNFYQPRVISAQATVGQDYNTLSSNLEVVAQPYPEGQSTYIRMFQEVNEQKAAFRFEPAPTLCVDPGDKISLNVTNNLSINTPPPTENNQESTYCKPNQNPQASPPTSSVGNTPGCLNTTNLHFHGLHVSPLSVDTNGEPVSSGTVPASQIQESSDDVLYDLEPGADNQYCPWLPAFHAPGTHWYHAHHHGSTAIQAAEGLAGALIVKEPEGQEICPGAPDVVMIMQEEPQALTGVNGLTAQENLDRGIYERTGRGNSGTFLINGEKEPTLKLQKGEIQRWRFINATSTPRAFTLLQLQDASGNPVAWYRVAVDGITLYGKQMNDPSVLFGTGTTSSGAAAVQSVPFAPGNRVDFLVNLQPGNYTLQKLVDGSAGNASQAQLLATIEVSDQLYGNQDQVAASFASLMANGIPTTGRPKYLEPITTIDKYNTIPVVFQVSNGTPSDRVTTAGRGNFRITNSKFDPDNLANIQADLNSSEEWIIANTSGAAHPFHIHVNPFLVVETTALNKNTQGAINNITGGDAESQQQIYDILNGLTTWTSSGIDTTIWWDTFSVPPNTAFKIRHRFDDYWGTYVLHCHVLVHEDQGMMWAVKINNKNGKGANPCQQLTAPVEV